VLSAACSRRSASRRYSSFAVSGEQIPVESLLHRVPLTMRL
jgi:hypothetical protein